MYAYPTSRAVTRSGGYHRISLTFLGIPGVSLLLTVYEPWIGSWWESPYSSIFFQGEGGGRQATTHICRPQRSAALRIGTARGWRTDRSISLTTTTLTYESEERGVGAVEANGSARIRWRSEY